MRACFSFVPVTYRCPGGNGWHGCIECGAAFHRGPAGLNMRNPAQRSWSTPDVDGRAGNNASGQIK